jgi:hypothetical protein
MSRIRQILLISILTALAARGQLYLLTASATSRDNGESPSYSSSIVRPDGKGGATEVREIVSQPVGVSWEGVSYDERKAVLVTGPAKGLPNILVVDFDKADVVKNCDWPVEIGASIFANWLAVQPGSGLSLEWETAAKEPKDNSIAAILLDPSVPCEKSIWKPPIEDVRYMVAHGGAGLGGLVSQETQLNVGISAKDETGDLLALIGRLVPLGYQVPANLRTKYATATLLANNRHVLVIYLNGKVIFFHKGDKTWHEWQVSGPPVYPRCFGKYLVAAKPGVNTAGEEEWRQEDSERGPATRSIMFAHEFSGQLAVYDTDAKKLFSISTNQNDSEVLLIENGIVYYRSATRLYSAQLTKNGVGPGRLLATSELIRDAHWAFIKH